MTEIGALIPPELVTAIGGVAAVLTTVGFAPQLIKAWRTRQTKDISLGMFALLSVGVSLWLAYGLMIGDIPLIAANAATLLQIAVILALKIRHG